MSDEVKEQPQATPPEQNPFVEELTRLGKNFGELIKEVLESPQLQEIRKEVATGAQTVIEEVNEVINKARESQVTQEVAKKATATVEELKAAPVTENLKTGLINTLRTINQELSEIIDRMEQASQQDAPTESAAASEQPPASTEDDAS